MAPAIEKVQTREVPIESNDIEKVPDNADVQDVNEVELSAYDFTPEESRAITKKFDLHILPWIFVAYLFNSLDRGNVSAAQSDGMTTDLNFPKNGYSLMITVFYIPFSVLVVPGVMLTRWIGPKWTIPGYIIGWGAMATVNAAVRNFGETVAVRMLLGAFEAGFAASLVFYLTTFYTRGELGKRIAVFYSCNCLSGAFSGLIAFGVFQMESHLHGWQVLFLIEGALTVFFGICIRIFLPFSYDTARFLNAREKEVARMRVLKDGSSESGSKFNVKKFFKPLGDWKYYVFAVIAVCYGTAAAIAGTFLVQIVRRFGLSVVMTNLYTVAPYFLGTIVLLITAYSSDHFRERGYHLASAIIFVILGCGILAGIPVSSVGVGYFATFLITCGAFTPSVLFHTWHQCNDPSEDGRAFRVGSFTFLANIGGIVGAQIFQDRWAPRYQIPLAVICALEGVGLACILGLRTWMYMDNRRRNKEQGVEWQSKDVPTEALAAGPSDPRFRHFYYAGPLKYFGRCLAL